MSIFKIFQNTQFIRFQNYTLFILISFFSTAHATTSYLTLNRTTIGEGEKLEVFIDINHEKKEKIIDAYLSVVAPDGTRYYYVFHETGITVTEKQIPFVTAWSMHSLEKILILDITTPFGLVHGDYLWEVRIVDLGSSPNEEKNTISSSTTLLKYGDYTNFRSAPDDFSPSPSLLPSTAISTFTSSVTPFGIPFDFPTDQQGAANVLTAGDIDDNINFSDFKNYISKQLNEEKSLIQNQNLLPKFKIDDRIEFSILDKNGAGISNAQVEFNSPTSQQSLLKIHTGSNGIFYLFPDFDNLKLDLNEKQLEIKISTNGETPISMNLDLSQLNNERKVTINTNTLTSKLPQQLDLMFILDTTGSMGDELNYLTAELKNIVSVVQDQYAQLNIRYGLVVYRDTGDQYIVQSTAFTDSVEEMEQLLQKQQASGGGDYPEAMELGLERALDAPWRTGNTARIAFLVADAPPHDENLRKMLDLSHTAREKGIHIYSLAASGVADTAEYLMRSISLLTQSRYLFLTDDSGVGNSHAMPVVPCYQVTKLSTSITRVIESELAGQRVEATTEVIKEIGEQSEGKCLPK